MIYLIIGLIVGGAIALVAGFLREKKLKRQLKNGEITEDDLSELVLSCFSVYTGYVLNALIQLGFGIILK